MRLGWIAALYGSDSTSDDFCTRSAGAITVVVTLELLLEGSASRLRLETVAVLIAVGAAGGVETDTVITRSGRNCPGSRNGGCVQVTVWPLAVTQLQPLPVAET